MYNITNILLLSSFVVNFRKAMDRKFGREPLNFVRLASYSWKCVLSITGQELELLIDVNMILGYTNSIIGGITRAIHHYAEADNKYVYNYDEKKESSYTVYLDFII